MTATRTRHRDIEPKDPNADQVCLLNQESARARTEPAGGFLSEARTQTTEGDRSEFRFDAKPGRWERIETFIDEERDCCPFFAFEQYDDGDDIVLLIIRPESKAE